MKPEASVHPHTVFVGIGSNVGRSRQIVEDALTVLEQHGIFSEVRVSRLYRTRAVGPAERDYVNGVLQARTAAAPHEVLAVLHFVEHVFGRLRRRRWGPRTLDLDLLFHGRSILATPDLVLPHPGVEERGFVLAPLADLDPGWTHPVTRRSVHEAWRRWLDRTPDACAQVVPLEPGEPVN